MQLLDVNVVVAAHRADHPLHADIRAWFDDLLAGDEVFTVPTVVWGSFLRVVTHRRIFEVPTPLAEAFAFVEAICAQPHYLPTSPGRRHVAVLRRLCEEVDAVGDLVPDAVVGAVAVEHGCEVVTLDRDFARFSSVRHRRPAPA
ncbi:MAG: type II toxin-antitoxin system VapC family toxin [Actinomycetota bacterium]|nr:type II toxin-antitoxin system VapC family toxin [Actinomycetota bacterium]